MAWFWSIFIVHYVQKFLRSGFTYSKLDFLWTAKYNVHCMRTLQVTLLSVIIPWASAKHNEDLGIYHYPGMCKNFPVPRCGFRMPQCEPWTLWRCLAERAKAQATVSEAAGKPYCYSRVIQSQNEKPSLRGCGCAFELEERNNVERKVFEKWW